MFGLGWQVLRERIGDVLDSARVRRATRVSGVAAVLALIAAVVLQVRFAWAGTSVLGAVVTIALTTAGVGLVCFSCFRTARPVDPAATINGRQVRPDTLMAVRWSVQPYLDRRPRPVAQDDRAAVLNDVPLLQRGLLRRLSRFGPTIVGFALLCLGAIVAGGFRSVAFVWPVLYIGMIPDMVVRLGRSERARLAALATAPPPDSDGPQWRRDPTGSKLGLPGE
ncbi:hypothetical protein [Curtobacterium pusillum]|uniref:hypothetical protein n=1 Tax=Curtobacterium pusillum TaxID=69373 RepID=UPI0011AA94B3|nr:hypothetical protein [Curtobacterium pusillum]